MRCSRCGWVMNRNRCRCGAGHGNEVVPVGTKVVFRPGRGPQMPLWMSGEVTGHQGQVHRVTARSGEFWCEAEDLLPDSPERARELTPGSRVWALWLDGRWFPGTVDAVEGTLRHVTWDDGDSMWLEGHQVVLLVKEKQVPVVGTVVVAQRWDGDFQPARVEAEEDGQFRVVYPDGEEDRKSVV